jgi:hypothetical protein
MPKVISECQGCDYVLTSPVAHVTDASFFDTTRKIPLGWRYYTVDKGGVTRSKLLCDLCDEQAFDLLRKIVEDFIPTHKRAEDVKNGK